MAKLWLLKLRFTSPIHHVVGRTGNSEQGGQLPGNDTILSAAAVVFHQIKGAFPHHWFDGDGAVALSTLLPYRWDKLFLPIPAKVLGDPEKDPLRQKRLNKVQWLEKETWERWAQGRWDEVAEGIIKAELKKFRNGSTNNGNGQGTPQNYLAPGDWYTDEVRERVALRLPERNRPNEEEFGYPNPHRMVSLRFRPERDPLDSGESEPPPNSALIISTNHEETRSELVRALEYLGEYFGLGGDRSLGFGRFELVGEEELNLSLTQNPTHLLTLGYFLPSESEIEKIDWPQSFWDYQWREGWNRIWGIQAGEPVWRPVRSKRVRMVTPGSMLGLGQNSLPGEPVMRGRFIDLYPEQFEAEVKGMEVEEGARRILRSGRTIHLPVKAPPEFLAKLGVKDKSPS